MRNEDFLTPQDPSSVRMTGYIQCRRGGGASRLLSFLSRGPFVSSATEKQKESESFCCWWALPRMHPPCPSCQQGRRFVCVHQAKLTSLNKQYPRPAYLSITLSYIFHFHRLYLTLRNLLSQSDFILHLVFLLITLPLLCSALPYCPFMFLSALWYSSCFHVFFFLIFLTLDSPILRLWIYSLI